MALASTDMAIDALEQHRDWVETRWRSARILVAPGPAYRNQRVEIVGNNAMIQLPEIAALGLTWIEGNRMVRGTRHRVPLQRIDDVNFADACRFMRAVGQIADGKWSCDATTSRREWARKWLAQHRAAPAAAPMAAGMAP